MHQCHAFTLVNPHAPFVALGTRPIEISTPLRAMRREGSVTSSLFLLAQGSRVFTRRSERQLSPNGYSGASRQNVVRSCPLGFDSNRQDNPIVVVRRIV